MMGRIYKHLGNELALLWTEGFKINTVHVEDVARASWHVSTWYVNRDTDQVKEDPIPIFNLADKQDTGNELKTVSV